MSKTPSPQGAGPARVPQLLRAAQLGTGPLTGVMLSAAAVLTVVAGVIPTAYAAIGLTALPLVFLLVGAVLAVFMPGYLAAARVCPSAGGLYTVIAAGLGRVPGVGAAWLAVVGYLSVQVAAYGAVGSALGPLIGEATGWRLPWWAVALSCWALVSTLGVLRVTVSAKVLAVLCAGELLIVMLTSASNVGSVLFSGHPHPIDLADSFDPAGLGSPAIGGALVIVVLAYVGIEQGIPYAEEARPRAVPQATLLTLGLITGLYTVSAWAMTVPDGPARTIEHAGEYGTNLVALAALDQLGEPAANAVRLLFGTSLIAAMLAFHNTGSRYVFSLARERVLPAWIARTHTRTAAPIWASALQSAAVAAVIGAYTVAGWDPVTRMFYLFGAAGGFAVLCLLTATSLAAVFLLHGPDQPRLGVWTRLICPIVATVLLAAMVALALVNFAAVLGVAETSPLRWEVPAALAVLTAAGCARGLWLRTARPEVYASIGRATRAALPEQLPDSPYREPQSA
ncbi:amino acid permease [Longispora fulva]|uniref:Amino acid transporter n=1 Tax=Longispora fulva TaxID=619741 RepID=A0A8J7KIC6_9ACTN|nr:APC family permease [Longispora fulva]MBG6136024.1 amino acid transporter [Longispora fulva]GIG55735.1 amino acid permease [Longispora fulva]